MSSIAMKMMRALRLITTPITPMAKRAALRIRYALKGTVPVMAPRTPQPALRTAPHYLLANTIAPTMAMSRMMEVISKGIKNSVNRRRPMSWVFPTALT